MLNLEKYFKKYVWDDQRTPYFVPVERMTRPQADYEVYAYSVFVGILFGVVSGASLLIDDPARNSDLVAVGGFVLLCAAIIFGATKQVVAAWSCTAAPAVVLLYFFFYGFPPRLGTIDHVVLIAFMVIWLRYSLRIVVIARAYEGLPERLPEPPAAPD